MLYFDMINRPPATSTYGKVLTVTGRRLCDSAKLDDMTTFGMLVNWSHSCQQSILTHGKDLHSSSVWELDSTWLICCQRVSRHGEYQQAVDLVVSGSFALTLLMSHKENVWFAVVLGTWSSFSLFVNMFSCMC